MIVIILSGGLGNQMFEYAAGRAIALRNNTKLVLNTTTGFTRDKVFHRVFCLDVFDIKYIRRRLLSFDFPLGYIFEKISRKLGRHLFFPWYKFVFDSIPAEEIKKNYSRYKNVVLCGTWVKQEFFDDYMGVIRDDFRLICSPSSRVLEYLEKMKKSHVPIIGMGVRVYQEITDEKVRYNGFFYTQGNFYNKALDYYKQKYSSFRLLIFTQAQDWVEKNVDLEGIDYEFVQTSTSDKDAINDLIIMSKCSDYIIANSSYYFWGTWLNPNKKDVVAPIDWKNSSLKEWIKL